MTATMRTITLLTLVITLAVWSAPPAASAVNVAGPVCTIGGLISGIVGKACTLATHAGRIIGAGRKLLSGKLGGALDALTGTTAARAVGVAAVVAGVAGGARYLLGAVAHEVDATTTPQLRSTWFSASYWRMASIAALLTVPFLCAAAIQAMMRGDAAMLARAAFGALPLGMLAIGIAAPLTMMLLAGTDEMSALIASASGHAPTAFLDEAGGLAGLTSAASGTLFATFFVGVLTAMAAIALWVELLTRQAAVYVIVLMLPLFFAALVWPARRIWAVRAVELLIALILSKFAIVAVLALGGAAISQSLWHGLGGMLAGGSLVMLACFSPWALMRLLPLHELAGAAAGSLRAGARAFPGVEERTGAFAELAERTVAARLTSVGKEERSEGSAAPNAEAGAEAVAGVPAGASDSTGADAGGPAGEGPANRAPGPIATVAQLPAPGSASPPPPADDDDVLPNLSRRTPGLDPILQTPDGVWRELNLRGADSGAPLIDPPPNQAGEVDPPRDPAGEGDPPRDQADEVDPAAAPDVDPPLPPRP